MKFLLALFSLILMVGSVGAQSEFQGFYGQLATGYEKNSIASTGLTMNNNSIFSGGNNPSKWGKPLIFGVGYNFEINNQFLLGIGADYSLFKTDVGQANINPPVQLRTGTSYKVSNRFNFFLSPGYILDKDKLAYVKAGYTNQRIKASYWDGTDNASCVGDSMGSGNAEGFLTGVGYRQIISKGFYGLAEANYYRYRKTSMGTSTLCDTTLITDFSPSASGRNFLVGIGYKF